MRKLVKIILVIIYVIFVVSTIIFWTPPSLVDLIATLIIPAISLAGIYYVNGVTFEKLFSMSKKNHKD